MLFKLNHKDWSRMESFRLLGICFSMFRLLKYRLSRIPEIHPFLWFISWFLIHKCTFLLPHDKSYFALEHFFANHENNLFVDVGANTGVSALSFRQLNQTMPIYSIEPNPMHQASLEKLKKKLQPFDFLLKGVGDKEVELAFYTPIYKGIVLHTFTSFSEAQVRTAVRKSFGIGIEEKLMIVRANVAVVRLDQLSLKPSIVKIDAEGFDYNILLGARSTIEECRPYIMVEACHGNIDDLHAFFKNINYRLLSYDNRDKEFSVFENSILNFTGGVKNIFAIPEEKLHVLPIA